MDDGGPSSSQASVSTIRSRTRPSSSSRCRDGAVASSCLASSRSCISRSSRGSVIGGRSYPRDHRLVIPRLAQREPRCLLHEPGPLGGQERPVHIAVRMPGLRCRVALVSRPHQPSRQVIPRPADERVRVREQQIAHGGTLTRRPPRRRRSVLRHQLVGEPPRSGGQPPSQRRRRGPSITGDSSASPRRNR